MVAKDEAIIYSLVYLPSSVITVISLLLDGKENMSQQSISSRSTISYDALMSYFLSLK
jgi:hypothetical protein